MLNASKKERGGQTALQECKKPCLFTVAVGAEGSFPATIPFQPCFFFPCSKVCAQGLPSKVPITAKLIVFGTNYSTNLAHAA